MNNDVKTVAVIACVIAIVFLLAIGYHVAPGVREAINENQYAVQKADDATNYETLKRWRTPAAP